MGKINQLLKDWRHGTIKLSSELRAKGYQTDLLNRYLKSGWLESMGYGAYKRANDKVEWFGALQALQDQTGLNIHPGGKTALAYKGYSHYLLRESARIQLFGSSNENLPKWFKDQSWMSTIKYVQTNLFDYDKMEAFSTQDLDNIKIKISAPELAVMEMLYLVPKEQTFDEAAKIMEGLTTLRTKLVQNLLEECKSVKVKRLFLFLAEKNGHKWLYELNFKRINLGSGKRVIVKNGTLDSKYKITYPKYFQNDNL
jgi:hypothetical protein